MVDQATMISQPLPLSGYHYFGPSHQANQVLLETLSLEFERRVLVTDAGSTKAEIVAQAEKVFTDKDVRFVGGHPWLVVTRRCAAAADATLFEKCLLYFLLLPA